MEKFRNRDLTVKIKEIEFTFTRCPNVDEMDRHFAAVSQYRAGKGNSIEAMPESVQEGQKVLTSLFDSLVIEAKNLMTVSGEDVIKFEKWRDMVAPDLKARAIMKLVAWNQRSETVQVFADARIIFNRVHGAEVAITLSDPSAYDKGQYDQAKRMITLKPGVKGYRGWYTAGALLFDKCLRAQTGYESEADIPAEHKMAAITAYFNSVDESLQD